MPRAPRRSKSRRAGYDEYCLMHLRHGHSIFPTAGFHTAGGVVDESAMREGWEILRADILKEWIAEQPGTRPWAWWKYDSPERRQRTDGIQHPFDDRVRKKRIEQSGGAWLKSAGYELFFGLPRLKGSPEEFAAEYESELQYLDRLNLLTDAEREELL